MKFYFVWTDKFNEEVEIKEDVRLFSINISQKEGEFAKARVKINKSIELAKQKYAKIVAEINGSIKTLFSGEVINIPVNVEKDLMLLELLSRHNEYELFLRELNNTKNIPPYKNEFFENAGIKSDVLEASCCLYYWDKVSGQVSLSDIVNGERSIDLSDKYNPDSFRVQYALDPIDKVNLKIKVSWLQERSFIKNLYEEISNKFSGLTFTADDLIKKFHGIVTRLQNRIDCLILSNKISKNIIEDVEKNIDGKIVKLQKSAVSGELLTQIFYNQKKDELFEISIINDHQCNSVKKFKELNYDLGIIPYFDDENYNNSFFKTGNGIDAIYHAILRAFSFIKFSTRCIYITFTGTVEDLCEVTLKDSVIINNNMFSGQNIKGKVVRTELIVDSSKSYIRLTIGVSVGKGINYSNEEIYDFLKDNNNFSFKVEEKSEIPNIVRSVKVFNDNSEQCEVISKDYSSINEFESAINSVKTDLSIKFNNIKINNISKNTLTAKEIIFSSVCGVKIEEFN